MTQDTSLVRPKRIVLIVDDDPVALEVARERLEREGFDVFVRDQALGTTQWIVEHAPDVVLLDVMMPALSGSELARVVAERAPTTIVILHSSKPVEELEELGVQAHAAGVLSKTLRDAAFLREFARIVRRAARTTMSQAG